MALNNINLNIYFTIHLYLIKDIKINNFKGIKRGSIENLSNINIFIGPNNSGKSTILESLMLISSFHDSSSKTSDILTQLINRRLSKYNYQENTKYPDRIYKNFVRLWYNGDIKNKLELIIQTENDKYVINLSKEKVFSILNEDNLKITTGIGSDDLDISIVGKQGGYQFAKEHYKEGLEKIGQKIELISKDIKVFGNFLDSWKNVYIIDSSIRYETQEKQTEKFSKLISERTDKKIYNILNEAFKTSIEAISFVPDKMDLNLNILLPSKSANIEEMGDGFSFSYNLLSTIYSYKLKIVLIEEIENHQHPSALKYLVKTLLEYAKIENSQIFIVTHSGDLIQFFIDQYRNQNDKTQDIDGIKTKVIYCELDESGNLNTRELSILDASKIEEVGIDIRFLREY
jgi:AAA15 family ATPase/GTPase